MMIQLDTIKNFYPPPLRDNALLWKYMLKEYILIMILDYLSGTPYIRKLSFIGGNCIRLTKGIDRFSVDLDFDCKDLSWDEFLDMTDGVIRYLRQNGLNVEARDRDQSRLSAFRRNLVFPGFLHELGLSGHREERFLIKIEGEDQGVAYEPVMTNIKGCGFYFPFPTPPDGVLVAMKLGAMLDRKKGRDFYDVLFLLSQSKPDYGFLQQKSNVGDLESLKTRAAHVLEETDLALKRRDFEHLLFNRENSKRILHMQAFFEGL
jgi:hypothetical protein